MPDPVTASLVFVGSAVISGVLGNRSDAGFKARWDKFRHNLEGHRPYANHELARAAYRAYLQATLQSCAALLQQNNLNVEAWFKLGILPEKMAIAFRSLLSNTPAGVFTQANKQWLEAVSQDHVGKIKLLDIEKLDPPTEYEHEEFAELLKEIELLMQPEEARNRERGIREALATRVLRDLENQFGEAPEDFTALVNARWFEFLCAGFQYCIKHQQEITNAFESRLLAKLVARNEWQHQLNDFGGESLKRIEAAQVWLRQEQREGFERVESLVTLLLPLLSFASDEAARNETLTMLIRAESDRVVDAVQDESEKTRAHVDKHFGEVKAGIERLAPQPSMEPEPLIHTLPTQQETEGREEECSTVLRAMSASEQHVLAFAAPGGFGKTALLASVVQEISADGKTFLDRVTLPNGETIETHITALLHVDCRIDVKLSALFAKAGRLIGQEQAFLDICNSETGLADRLQEILNRLSTDGQGRVWLVFDNFEPLLNDKGEIADPELRDFFSAIFAGGHGVYALISAREVPRFSPREKVLELVAVGGSLFEGLPLDDCLAYLKKNDAAKGLNGTADEIDVVFREFALRVHRIPLALVWAVGYLRDTGYTLKEVLDRQELFADFDQEQAKDADRYESKGLKRLHYEQLKIQTRDSLPVLCLLAFFKRAVPKGVLAHLLSEIELNRTLTRLERNKIITRKETADAYTQYLNDMLAVNLYALHPVICENEFFDELPDMEALYETTAKACRKRAASAYEVNRFAYGLELLDCGEKLYEHLTEKLRRADLLNNYAGMLMSKGAVLGSLTRSGEAVAEFSKAIAIIERLVNVEQQAHLANDLAGAYMNKGRALHSLSKLTEAVAEHDKAITIIERLVNVEQQVHLANDLAMAYRNKGGALHSLTKFTEAVVEHDKAITIIERLVNVEQQVHLANDLAGAYVNKGMALESLNRLTEAVVEHDKAMTIIERLVNVEQQVHLANDLAMAYVNKGGALHSLTKFTEAVVEHDKAITIIERLVNVEHQAHLANDLAGAYVNKGGALESLTRLTEAVAEYDKAITIIERLVNVEQQAHLAHDLAIAYGNKGGALATLTRTGEAVAEYDKAITIIERLVNVEQQAHLAHDLAGAYMNKGVALERLLRPKEAVAEHDKAIAIIERLVNVEQQAHLANDLAGAYLNKGTALERLGCFAEAVAEYDIAIAIIERLVNVEQQAHLANDLAGAYMNKGAALHSLSKLTEAVAEHDKAITIIERLANVERQAHLANDLAMAYVNKGVALESLTRSGEAVREHDKAIAIIEQLVNVEQQTHLANDLAGAYVNKGMALESLNRLTEAVVEHDKAIAIIERLVDVEQQAHLSGDLAGAYMNKGSALESLNRLTEALAHHDKAIVIFERLVNVEQRTDLAKYLARAYVNKGIALHGLTRLLKAIAEYDKAIAIFDGLVNVEQQAHLADDLATTYLKKAMALEQQQDWDHALVCYDKSLRARTFCVEQLNMFWTTPALLQTLRCRVMTLLDLRRWRLAARDVLRFRSLYKTYTLSDAINDGLKDAAGKEFTEMIASLRSLTTEQRELLDAELGDEAEEFRSLVSESAR